VRIEEQSPTHRKTTTWSEIDGVQRQVSETVEDLSYEDVTDGDRWLGRVLRKSVLEEATNLEAEYPKRVVSTTRYGYDEQWRLVLRDEEKWQRDQDTGDPSIFLSHLITSYEQLTPTDVRTCTKKLASDGQVLSSDYQQAPGTLQSSLHQQQSLAESQWQTNEDGTQPDERKGIEYTRQWHASSDGGGTLPRVYRNENLRGVTYLLGETFAIGQQIATDLADESGEWLYTVKLSWPRPFSYRKGQTVTLTNLPGDCPDLTDSIITRLHTTFDVEAAVWRHEVECEAWRES
jgi:hypothetical protein